jgi:hypothetical protein
MTPAIISAILFFVFIFGFITHSFPNGLYIAIILGSIFGYCLLLTKLLQKHEGKYYRPYVEIDDNYFTPITTEKSYSPIEENYMSSHVREKLLYNPCKKCIKKRHCTAKNRYCNR